MGNNPTVTESQDSVSCPSCGGDIKVPGRNWHGGDLGQPYKSCDCVPVAGIIHPDQKPSESIHDLSMNVHNLERWVNILARLIPHGYGSSHGTNPYIAEDLHSQSLSLPEHVLKALLESKEKELREYHGQKTEIFVKVCLYCGFVQFSHSGSSVGEIRFLGYELCSTCSQFKGSDPMTFQWISKVIKFGYVRAPEEMMPVMPPPPPPPPPSQPEPVKAITLDE